MKSTVSRAALALGAAVCALSPAAALAQSADVEARIRALEAAVTALQTQLEAERLRNAQPQTIEPARVEALERRVAEPPPEGFRVGNANVRLGGFVKVDGVFSRFNDGPTPAAAGGGTNAREFYVPGATPVGGTGEDWHFNGHAKQTRLTLTVTPNIEGHRTSAFVEMDFASVPGTTGSQTATNAYSLGLRRAYITYDDWLFGQDWTTFQNTAVLPETTDFIGNTDGTPFVRQPLVRWTHRVNEHLTFVAAAENPDTTTNGVGTGPTSTFNDDDFIPDVVLRGNLTLSGGRTLAVAALLRNLSVDNPGYDESALGWGLSLTGKLPFGANNRHDIRFGLTGGEGIGRYLGLGFASDAYAIQTTTRSELDPIGVFAGHIAARFQTGPRTRINLGFNYQSVDNVTGLAAASANETAYSAFANLFFSPVAGMDLGVEYRRGYRETFNGLDGTLDRLHFVAKRTF